MIFLPIVGRELRVAARQRGTHWLRVVSALVAFIIGGGFLTVSMVGRVGNAGLGSALFGVLTWISLAAVLSSGLFLTSDCLSEEKREGTLGFLFLTDLRGYDVVLGKLLATSLRSFYALLAVFPILAITLLMGGVTGPQFWRTLLALLSALVFSLAGGLFVSSISRDSQKALAATLLLLLVVMAGGPLADQTMALSKRSGFQPIFSLASPAYVFMQAGAGWGTAYWPGLLVSQIATWTLLGMSCLLLPRTWQEKSTKPWIAGGDWHYWWKYGSVRRRASLRRKLLGLNPVLWLASRERWQSVWIWALACVVAGGLIVAIANRGSFGAQMVWGFLAGAVALLLYLAVASQACRFFVEARRSGLIELLLASPLSVNQIVQGQGRALLGMFGPPLVLCLAAQLAGTILLQRAAWTSASPATTVVVATNSVTVRTPTGTGTIRTTSLGRTNQTTGGTAYATIRPTVMPVPGLLVTLINSAAGTITTAANLVALGWFGMWMGLTSKNANLATLKTILFVQVIPWFVISFSVGIAVYMLIFPVFFRSNPAPTPQFMGWFPLISAGVTTVLVLSKDAFFFVWARRKLHAEFRERAAQTVAPLRAASPLSPPRPASAPPVITS